MNESDVHFIRIFFHINLRGICMNYFAVERC